MQDSVWTGATAIAAFIQAEPQEGAPPSEQTTVLLLYDAEFLYIGVRAFDAGPDRIVAKIRQRDSSLDGDDSFWGFNAQRTIARKNEIVRWTAASRNKHVAAMGDAGRIENLAGLRQGLGLALMPSATLKLARNHQRARTAAHFEPSLDLFYQATPAVTFSFTLNTDFAEAEVDERQVNFSRFPLFFAEKRDFFLQDANYFRFGGIQTSPLPFFSRRRALDLADVVGVRLVRLRA